MLLVASNRKPNSSCLNLTQGKPSVEWILGWVWVRERHLPTCSLCFPRCRPHVRLELLQDLQMPLMAPVNDLVSCSGLDKKGKLFLEPVWDGQGSVFPRALCRPVLRYCWHQLAFVLISDDGQGTGLPWSEKTLEPTVSLARGNVAKWLKLKKGAARRYHVVY